MKKEKVYVFIDSQNLNLGTSKNIFNRKRKLIHKGWKLDYQKFYRYLFDKYKAQKVFLFIGYIKENEGLYRYLKKCGYKLIYKPTTKDGFGKPKGNVDAELVLYSAAIEFGNYDKAVIISGDGDFYCLLKFLKEKKKLLKLIIPNRVSASTLLRKLEEYKIFIQREKDKLEKR